MAAKTHSIFEAAIVIPAIAESFKKLNPLHMVKNPVMFVTEVGAAVTTVLMFSGTQGAPFGFLLQITLWLWFTVLFANFAEAMAEGRGKAQADSLRKARTQTFANRIKGDSTERVSAEALRKGDLVIVKAAEFIPGDGEIIEGAATVDESAITGESAPVVREAGGDRSAVTGGTRVLSDVIKIRITSNPGETFLDRMIGLVEGAKRQKTPNEIALTILLSALTLIFLVVLMALKAYGVYQNVDFSTTVLVALLVCLIPTTIGGLLSAIGIAGIDRLVQKNVLAIPPSSPTFFDKANDVEAQRSKSPQIRKGKDRPAFLSERRCHRAVSCSSVETALPQNPRDKTRRTQAIPNPTRAAHGKCSRVQPWLTNPSFACYAGKSIRPNRPCGRTSS